MGFWFGCWLGFFFLPGAGVCFESFHEDLGEASAAVWIGVEFCGWGEGAVGGVEGDLFYGLWGGLRWGLGFGGGVFGEVGAGDLEGVEEQAGAAGVDVVGGEALDDLADGVLDGGAVFGQGQVEGGAAAAALFWISYRFSGGVVVVAEVLAAEAGAGAAVAVGEDVAALVLLRFGVVGVVHVCTPPGGSNVCKVFKRKDLTPDFSGAGLYVGCELNAKARLLAGPFVSIYLKNSRLEGTTTPGLFGFGFMGLAGIGG